MGPSVHLNGRVYDPLTARFISADSEIQDPSHSQSYNRYSYVWNNPTNLIDPSGFELTEAQQSLVNSVQATLDAGGTVSFEGAVGDAMFAGIPSGTSSYGSLSVNNYTWQSAGFANATGDNSASAQVTSASASGNAGGVAGRSAGANGAGQSFPSPDYRMEITGHRIASWGGGLSPAEQKMLWWIGFNPFEAMAYDAGARGSAAEIGFAATMIGNPKQLLINGVERVAENAAARTFYHYTDAAGAEAIKESGKILPNARGQVFLTQEKLAKEEVNDALMLGKGGEKGTHVVEVKIKEGVQVNPGKNEYEFIHNGTIRDGRQADMTVGPNEF